MKNKKNILRIIIMLVIALYLLPVVVSQDDIPILCGNGMCEGGEDRKNCPRDCAAEDENSDYGKLVKKEQELQADLKKETAEWNRLQKKKDRTYEDDKRLEELDRKTDILANSLSVTRREKRIESSKLNIKYYEDRITEAEWFAENAQTEEERERYKRQIGELERFRGIAEEGYAEKKYKPINWEVFANEMFTGFAAGRFYERFGGLAKLGSLLMGEDEMTRNREKLREIFCDILHLPTTQCLASKICSRFPDDITRDSALVVKPSYYKIKTIAHIEATKSKPITVAEEDMEERLYTATFSVDNSLDTSFKINIELMGSEATYLWIQAQELGAQTKVSRTRANPLIEYLDKDYSEICLVFSPEIEDYKGKKRSRLCGPIIEKG